MMIRHGSETVGIWKNVEREINARSVELTTQLSEVCIFAFLLSRSQASRPRRTLDSSMQRWWSTAPVCNVIVYILGILKNIVMAHQHSRKNANKVASVIFSIESQISTHTKLATCFITWLTWHVYVSAPDSL